MITKVKCKHCKHIDVLEDLAMYTVYNNMKTKERYIRYNCSNCERENHQMFYKFKENRGRKPIISQDLLEKIDKGLKQNKRQWEVACDLNISQATVHRAMKYYCHLLDTN